MSKVLGLKLAVCGLGLVLGTAAAFAQRAPAAPAPPPQLRNLDPNVGSPATDPFPAVNQKYFTAATPTAATVDKFLQAIWGYDPLRIWRVEAIQTTSAPGVSKVTVYVSEKTPNAKVSSSTFFVTPDGQHAIADGVISFGEKPFAETRALLAQKANGPSRGNASKDLELVEFADLQCPHCKEAQGTMEQLVKDFPEAHVVYQLFPLTEVHPAAFEAAAYGKCVAQRSSDAYFLYAKAVYDTQEALTPADKLTTLKAAVVKAGQDPTAIATCAATQPIKDAVAADIKLADDAGVDQTPLLAVNGHMLPITSLPYETVKKIIAYQAQLDGVSTAAGSAAGAGVAGSATAK